VSGRKFRKIISRRYSQMEKRRWRSASISKKRNRWVHADGKAQMDAERIL